ncbi:hypothetical protein BY996DRAFT_6829641 [Phakopsora pachyrhizi]|uniref:Uncharacterized protein n=1 Tax=Phakopsora pachyrhizi TaxID=170000 RepID=A0AAV0BEI5_PHAPC|nr:hypothetical protein BY996DRAFT_6829641 [Phakopsora pachyrhizi]CAH7685564.1 hypothetical protein PPACK8108_LOCUS20113 [Phakopsora pachyrhizi]
MMRSKSLNFLFLGLFLIASASITVVASIVSRRNHCVKNNRYSPPSTSEYGTYQDRRSKGWNLIQYTAVVIFGASDSDNAHSRDSKYNETLRPAPYFRGRFTNGPVFGEILSSGTLTGKKLNDLNYAYGDATVSNQLVPVNAPDIKSQIDYYIQDLKNNRIERGYNSNGDDDKKKKKRVLHIFWIGINDVIKAWSDMVTSPDFNSGQPKLIDSDFGIAKSKVKQSVKKLIDEINQLVNNDEVNGSKDKGSADFLVMMIPPLEIVPNLRYQSLEKSSNDKNLAKIYLDYIGRLTSEYNQNLKFETESLAKKSPVKNQFKDGPIKSGFLKIFDSVSLFRQVYQNPGKFGFSNITEPCWNSTTGGICKNPDQWGYWDTLHPTTSFQKLIAQEITVSCNT